MPLAHNTLVDPLDLFIDDAVDADRRPVPLVSTRFDVTLAGGLAAVSAVRVFRNAETKSIEATITLPVPVHAQVFELSARIGERPLIAVAKARGEARQTYEDAIDRGKAAVLHEEALRGVHVLSVAHIAPGEEIEVRIQWVQSLHAAGDRLKLRIPTTVGEIYGRSPLVEVDDLLTGGDVQIAQLSITSEGLVWLGEMLVEGDHASAPLNRPIDLSIPTALPRRLAGLAADGSRVGLNFSAASGDEPLDLAILVDRSGSMHTRCAAHGARTKHRAVVKGLAAACLGAGDRIHLWQFDEDAQRVGEAHGARFRKLTARLAPPRGGGTEIGEAISTVIEVCKAADILVITDGQSIALDVQALARHGRRVSVVLVGEDSLEAHIGHLAALTGGEIFVASDADIPAVIQAAFTALRDGSAVRSTEGVFVARRGGMVIEAIWNPAETDGATAPELARAVAALAASLRLPTLTEAEAAQFAEREGLVTHLTSLVLVDEVAATQEDLPLQRKVALPEPAVYFATSMAEPPEDDDHGTPMFLRRLPSEQPPVASSEDSRGLTGQAEASHLAEETNRRRRSWWARLRQPSEGQQVRLPQWLSRIDWAAHGGKLASGDLTSLPSATANTLTLLSRTPWAAERALALGLIPLLFAILAAALAAEANGNRAAGRVARRLMGARPRSDLPPVSELLVQFSAV